MTEEVKFQQPTPVNIVELIKKGVIPDYYINGFTIGYTVTEIHIVLNEHGKEKCSIEIPFPVAKSLVNAIQIGIRSFEEKTKQTVLSLEELQSTLLPKK